jgi:hypothetical protein
MVESVCLRMCALLVHEVYLGIFSEHILIEHILSKIEATPCLCTMCNLSYSWLGTLPHKKKNFQSQFPSGLYVAHVLNITPLYTVFWTGSAHWQKKNLKPQCPNPGILYSKNDTLQGNWLLRDKNCDFWGFFFSKKIWNVSAPIPLLYIIQGSCIVNDTLQGVLCDFWECVPGCLRFRVLFRI